MLQKLSELFDKYLSSDIEIYYPNLFSDKGRKANIVDGLFEIAKSINRLTEKTGEIGWHNASFLPQERKMGAIEALIVEIRDSTVSIIDAVDRLKEE